jgi:hypothetical protein
MDSASATPRHRDTATLKAPSGKTLLTSCLFTFEPNFQLHFRLECILCYCTKMNPFAFLGAGPTLSTERRWGGGRATRRDANARRGKVRLLLEPESLKSFIKKGRKENIDSFFFFVCFLCATTQKWMDAADFAWIAVGRGEECAPLFLNWGRKGLPSPLLLLLLILISRPHLFLLSWFPLSPTSSSPSLSRVRSHKQQK